MIPISCDYCGYCCSCRFEYIDPGKRDLPMLFCSVDCLDRYVKEQKITSLDEPSAEGAKRPGHSLH